MEKRYQVFVSSTFTDLQEERRKVIQSVMETDCFPAGMELFPAADEEQWRFIQQVIAECDYYVLIVGGRYGSVTDDGVSYTEKEFDFAVERGLKVLAFIYEQPDGLPANRSEPDPAVRAKLESFRSRVAQGRLVKYWKSPDELAGQVALSLLKTIKAYPAEGWVRASAAATNETLVELNQARKQVATLERELEGARKALQTSPAVDNIAPLSQELTISGNYHYAQKRRQWSTSLRWEELFALISPELLDSPSDVTVRDRLTSLVFARARISGNLASIEDVVYDTIKVQLMALRLVTVDYLKTVKGGMGLFWQLTSRGRDRMLELRAVRATGGPVATAE